MVLCIDTRRARTERFLGQTAYILTSHESPAPAGHDLRPRPATIGPEVGHALVVDLLLFEEVGDALRGLIPAELGVQHQRVRRYGIKVWFDAVNPPREHYEAQVIGASGVEGATMLAIEVGFHAEHPNPANNEAVLAKLAGQERRWRKPLGPEAVAGGFLGRPDDWCRVSETWPDPDLSDPGLGIELAARLTDYVLALEPALRS